jgi:hypothetical protein
MFGGVGPAVRKEGRESGGVIPQKEARPHRLMHRAASFTDIIQTFPPNRIANVSPSDSPPSLADGTWLVNGTG